MKYQEYYQLAELERTNLVRTNYFRNKHDLPLIEVPKSNKKYWKEFNKITKNAKSITKERSI